jgi:arylsulfatase
MIALWYVEAGKYNVLPLDSRGTARFADERPQLSKDRQVYVYYPDTQVVPENVAVKVLNRAHSFTAEVEIPKGGAEGVIVCHGSNAGGYSLFVRDGKLHYVHNYVGAQQFHIESTQEVPKGKCKLRYEFEPTGKPDVAKGKGAPGRGQLYINGKLVGKGNLPVTVPLLLGLGGGVSVGRNPGSSVSSLYEPPFAFTGRIFKVTADVSGKMIQDTEEEAKAYAKAAMARH